MKRIFRNIKSLLNAYVIDKVFNTLAFILIARILFENEYGVFTVALSFASIFTYLGDLGMSNTLIREVNKNPNDKYIYLTSFIKVKFIFTILSALFSTILVLFLYEGLLLKLTLILTISMIFGNFFFTISKAFYQAIQEMKYISKISFVSSIITFSGVTLIYLFGMKSLFLIIVVYSTSKLIGGILSILVLKKHLILCKFSYWNKQILVGLISFSIGGIILMLMPQAPPIIMERFVSLENIAIFSIAFKIPLILYTLPGIIAASYYPNLFKFAKRKSIHTKLIVSETRVIFIIGLILIMPFIIEPEFLITILFGEKWISAVPILKILILIVIIQCINFPLGDGLSTLGLQSYRNFVYIFAFVFLIASYSFIGQLKAIKLEYFAYSSVLVEIIILFLFSIRLKYHAKKITKMIFPFVVVSIIFVWVTTIFKIENSILNIMLFYTIFLFIICMMESNLRMILIGKIKFFYKRRIQ